MLGGRGLIGCRNVMARRGIRRCKVADTPNQQNQKNPQADRDEEQRRQQQQQGGQDRQQSGQDTDQAPDKNPQQR